MQTQIQTINGPSAWTASSLSERDWRVDPPQRWVETVRRVVDDLERRGVSLDHATADDFAGYGALQAAADTLMRRLRRGPGFAVMSGTPVDEIGDLSALVYWGLGTRLGVPRLQSARGKRIHRVEADSGNLDGGSTSNQGITLHTENARPPCPPRLLSLLCLRAAARDGESLLASGHAVHDRIVTSDVLAAQRLYSEVNFGRQPEQFEDGHTYDRDRIFTRGRAALRVRYSRYWIDRGVEAAREPLDDELARAMTLVDELLEDDEFIIRPLLEPGDILLVDNTVVMHGRAAFTDGAAPRCLLRLWVD